jgi:hypothetical protein
VAVPRALAADVGDQRDITRLGAGSESRDEVFRAFAEGTARLVGLLKILASAKA